MEAGGGEGRFFAVEGGEKDEVEKEEADDGAEIEEKVEGEARDGGRDDDEDEAAGGTAEEMLLGEARSVAKGSALS